MLRNCAAVAVLACAFPAAAAVDSVACPPSLRAAAQTYREVLEDEHKAIREGTPAAPTGVEETVQFDLEAHACHRGPGQAYRVYGDFVCGKAGADGEVQVDYRYNLFFRKALTLEALFDKPWQAGSDGILRVRFQPEGEAWVPVGRRDVLDLSPAKGHQGRPTESRGGNGNPP